MSVIATTEQQQKCRHRSKALGGRSWWVAVEPKVYEDDGRRRTHVCRECFAKRVQ